MRLSLWPQSLFGRLLAASVVAVVLGRHVGREVPAAAPFRQERCAVHLDRDVAGSP